MKLSVVDVPAVALWLLAGIGAAHGQPPATHHDLLGRRLPEGVVAKLGGNGLVAKGEVEAVAFSPDGKRLAAASELLKSRCIEFWNAETGEFQSRVPLPLEWEMSWIAFSADGELLFSPQGVLDLASGAIKTRASPLLASSPDGRLVLRMNAANQLAMVRHEAEAELWSIAEGNEEGRFTAVAFSPQADLVAASLRNGRLLILDATTGAKLAEPTDKFYGVAHVAFSPAAEQLAFGGADKALTLLDVETGKPEQSLPGFTRGVSALAFSPDGRWIAASGSYERHVTLWNVKSGRVERDLSAMVAGCRALAFSPDGARLAIGGRTAGGPNLQIFEVATGKELFVPDGPRLPIQQIAFSISSRQLATGSADGRVHLWDTTDATPRLELHADSSQSLSFSPDGWALAAAGSEGEVNVWEADTGDTLFSCGRHALRATAALVAPADNLLAYATRDGKIELLNFATGEKLCSIQAYKDGASSLAFSPDGKLLASAGGSASDSGGPRSIELWNPKTGKQVRTLNVREWSHIPHKLRDLRFSPVGDLIAGRGDDGTHLWDIASGEHVQKLDSGSFPYCFAPNGRYLIGHSRWALNVIELITGEVCLELSLESTGKTCTALAVSPDGRLLALGTRPTDGVTLLSLAPPGVDLHTPPTRDEITQAWEQLARLDARAGYKAAWTLAVAENRTVDFFRERLASLTALNADPERVEKLIADLDDDHFEVRQQATTALQDLGPTVMSRLKQAAEAEKLSAEHRLRLSRVIATMETATRRFGGSPLRRLRAIGVLERIGTRNARELLARIAAGTPTARETVDAKSALLRLEKRLIGP